MLSMLSMPLLHYFMHLWEDLIRAPCDTKLPLNCDSYSVCKFSPLDNVEIRCALKIKPLGDVERGCALKIQPFGNVERRCVLKSNSSTYIKKMCFEH